MDVRTTIATSAEAVDSIDDILIQILLRLPAKSLMRFKVVSKRWKSFITSRRFSLLYNPGCNPVVGLFFPDRKSLKYEYIHLDGPNQTNPPFRELNFPGENDALWIHQSCNGLLLCCSYGGYENRSPMRSICVYNPTSNCFTKLPRPGIVNEAPRIVVGVNLAFDPAKFPIYKVVCVRGSEFNHDLYQIEVYSAESGVWTLSGEPFKATTSFNYGVFWNGSIHWINHEAKELLYFNVDEERLMNMPLPGDGHRSRRRSIGYFGESCDHLHLIETQYLMQLEFDVYEMERDYSEWFVKYHVDLNAVPTVFPEMVSINRLRNGIYFNFTVFSLVRVERGPFLVLQIGRKAIRVNLDDSTFEEICNLGNVVVKSSLPHAFEYIESLACV